MGARQSYPRPKTEGAELVIHGIVYDISDFAKKHPGGGIILESLNAPGAGFPADATCAFDQLHGHSKKPLQWLTELKKQGRTRKLTLEERKAMMEQRPYDEKLQKSYKDATRRLKDQGLFDYSLTEFLWRNFELVALMSWGAWCAVEPGKYFGWWHGALILGIFMQRGGWFQHECNHGSASKYHWLNNFVGSFWFGFCEAGSAGWWKREHNRHHADPQRHGADIDMNTLPLALDSITARKGFKPFLRLQAWLYQVSIWALVHVWQLWIHPKFIIRHRVITDGVFLILHWVAYFNFFVPRIGIQSAIALHICASAFEASLLFTNFALSHTTMPYLEYTAREHWVERSLRRTVDIHSHHKSVGPVVGFVCDKFVDWLMGFLNYQVVHHMWPLMPHYKQRDPRVHKAIQDIIDENPELNLAYNVTTYWQAMYDMYANLSSIALDHGAGRNPDAQHPTKPEWVRGIDPNPVDANFPKAEAKSTKVRKSAAAA
ncbi:fatty acid desaturase-domain-containing protein [Globomyces pollinis-pini]|nr:fatty acid desaturase-domain-containing protein [Globomyces pollinis-pini]